MRKTIGLAMLVWSVVAASGVAAEDSTIQGGMLLNYAADKVIHKFLTSTCEELKAKESQPPSEKEKTAVEFLHDDLQAQKAFIDMIAAPVMNKMFECGLIP